MKVLDSLSTVGRTRDREQDRSQWERLQNVGLAALGVVAAVGVVFALQAPEARDDPTPSPSASTSLTPSLTPSDEPSDTSSAEPTPTPPVTESTTMLMAEVAATRLRAPLLECEGGMEPVVVQFSSDGGPWETSSVPGLVTITGMNVLSDGFARVVGHEQDCTPASYLSRDGGSTWVAASSEVRFWSVLPGNTDQVASPTGAVDVPCEPRAVSAINATVARLWCTTGQIVGTADGGAHWVALGSLPDALSIDYLDAADGVALAVDPACDGISVLVTRDGGSDWETVHCAEVSGPWGVVAGTTTITVAGGEASESSDDVGESWTSD